MRLRRHVKEKVDQTILFCCVRLRTGQQCFFRLAPRTGSANQTDRFRSLRASPDDGTANDSVVSPGSSSTSGTPASSTVLTGSGCAALVGPGERPASAAVRRDQKGRFAHALRHLFAGPLSGHASLHGVPSITWSKPLATRHPGHKNVQPTKQGHTLPDVVRSLPRAATPLAERADYLRDRVGLFRRWGRKKARVRARIGHQLAWRAQTR